ncbi:hypothetical protein SB725_14410 [Pseudomonas sp. SIMBA_041]|uniref:hypothetical protein n=1 Tax=unclassified Pseudomonas TaxID=196821 RepID=UPI000720B4A1|nr:hypothetical protein [Pseudomonas sp. URMO17WK12:I11]CRL47264.1 hypothetical protein PSHI_02850 [Pseudomonas sp. URMO17WK12:I11]
MPNFTGTVESFRESNPTPNPHIDTTIYSITIIPDDGGKAISITESRKGRTYNKGQKITYSGTLGPKGEMLYSIHH